MTRYHAARCNVTFINLLTGTCQNLTLSLISFKSRLLYIRTDVLIEFFSVGSEPELPHYIEVQLYYIKDYFYVLLYNTEPAIQPDAAQRVHKNCSKCVRTNEVKRGEGPRMPKDKETGQSNASRVSYPNYLTFLLNVH